MINNCMFVVIRMFTNVDMNNNNKYLRLDTFVVEKQGRALHRVIYSACMALYGKLIHALNG